MLSAPVQLDQGWCLGILELDKHRNMVFMHLINCTWHWFMTWCFPQDNELITRTWVLWGEGLCFGYNQDITLLFENFSNLMGKGDWWQVADRVGVQGTAEIKQKSTQERGILIQWRAEWGMDIWRGMYWKKIMRKRGWTPVLP